MGQAPWLDGFYERQVRSVKTPLWKIFAKVALDVEQLSYVFVEIEAQSNIRPLTYNGSDPADFIVITPAKILVVKNLQTAPTKVSPRKPSVRGFSIVKIYCQWVLDWQ